MESLGYLLDAAKQLESAARKLRKASNGNEHLFNRRAFLAEARVILHAASARMDGAADELRAICDAPPAETTRD